MRCKKSDYYASVMVFGAISRLGKSKLCFKKSGVNLDSKEY
jgi:hypothetical protein